MKEEKLNPQPMFGDRETLMEAFDYAKLLTEQEPTPDPQHPQIYDGCPGEVPITKI